MYIYVYAAGDGARAEADAQSGEVDIDESGEVDMEAGWVALRILAPPASANERLVLWSGGLKGVGCRV